MNSDLNYTGDSYEAKRILDCNVGFCVCDTPCDLPFPLTHLKMENRPFVATSWLYVLGDGQKEEGWQE
jgi:hypothetical protein